MKKVAFKDVKPYNPPGHFDVKTLRVHGKEETGIQKFWMGVSHFMPGGGAEWAYEDNPLEKIYFVLEGEVTIKSKTEEFVLRKWDSIFIPPFEGRSIVNNTNMPASMLVVVNYPEE